MIATPTKMIFELETPEAGDELVDRIHEQLDPAVKHIINGGSVTVTRKGEVIGIADTVEQLLALAIR